MLNAMTLPWQTWVVLTGIVGLLVGSFLNVVIYRLPRMMERQWRADCESLTAGVEAKPLSPYNLAVPRSACPHCQTPIRATDNLPVLSWLLLRGCCRACRGSISIRYPLVELVTAILSIAVVWRFGATWEALCGLALTWALICLTVIDFDTQLLPDQITLPLLWLGLLAARCLGRGPAALPVDIDSAVVGAMAGYLSLWLVFQGFKAATGKEGMGRGDFKLLAALGAWLGWQLLLPILLFSAGAGAIWGIALIALKRHDREQPIPFGPYLAVAGWLIMMWSQPLTASWWPLTR